MLLMVFRKSAFREFVLPNTENVNYSFRIDHQLFDLKDDFNIELENTVKNWYILSSDKYTMSFSELMSDKIALKSEMIIDITTSNNEVVSVLAVDSEISFKVFKKYLLSDNIVISVGAGDENMIRYNFTNLVSSSHCTISVQNGSVTIYDTSSNGVFVNHKRISGSYGLRFGDIVSIFGLSFTFVNNILCIGTSFGNVEISDILETYRVKAKKGKITKKHFIPQKQYFNRSPRVLPNINKGEIRIDPPPSPQFSKKRPLFNIIGPSFTMAIPMMLGMGLSVFSTVFSGKGASAFMFTGIITAVGSALLGSIWAVLNLRQTRREEIEQETVRFDAYGNYLISISDKLKQQYSENERAMHKLYPSASYCTAYTSDSPQLWNRNYYHPDFLYVRLGLGDIPFQVKISIPEEKFTLVKDELKRKPEYIYDQFKSLRNVPVGMDLRDNRLIGLVGSKENTYEIIDCIVAQIAANNSYTDVKIAFGSNDRDTYYGDKWNYIKYLPHNWASKRSVRFFGSDKEESSDMLYELANIVRHRAEENNEKDHVRPHFVLIITDVSLLDGELISKYVFEPKNCYGLTTIIVSEYRENLPNNCNMIIEKNPVFSGFYNSMSTDGEVQSIIFDTVSPSSLLAMSKNLANIRINELEDDSGIPGKLEFLEMLNVSDIDELNILDQWRKNRTYNSMRAIIGKKSGGADCYLDIYEKYHGPHGLVAGTTGSGKSEILQTLILSLAINFSPEDVSFFVIDFKGGGMANLFLNLPHLIGSISNLAGNQIRRAMISIKSENKRRQRLFNDHGVNNIDAYTRLYKNGEASRSIPHLVIIIDEFAELKREGSEEYMRELISVAQVGRSLGVHLILATQKPSGTVSDDIWSNSKFKLCLRVQDKKDSNDMLHKPDAAFITQAGRCFLQVGNDEIYEQFQSGWSGAVYDPGSGNRKTAIATMITSTGKTAVTGSYTKMKKMETDRKKWYLSILECICSCRNRLYPDKALKELSQDGISEICSDTAVMLRERGYYFAGNDMDMRCLHNFIQLIPDEYKTQDEAVKMITKNSIKRSLRMPESREKTQLEAVVEYIAELAAKNNYHKADSLWLPVLPAMLPLERVTDTFEFFNNGRWTEPADYSSIEITVGMYDDPENQSQLPLDINLSKSGHIALTGTVVSGKSTFIQTFAYSLMSKYDPSVINFYFIDYSSNLLSCFENFPHVGGVLTNNESDKINKLFNLIAKIVEERKRLFGSGNFTQYIKSTSSKIPIIMLVIDNYANFKDKTANKYEDALIRLSREGLSYGIYLFISSAGFGMSEISNRMGDNIKTVISLEMGDKYKYAEVFRTTRPTVLPDEGIKGRGLVIIDGRFLEFQTAVAVEAEDDYRRGDIIRGIGKDMNNSWNGIRPREIPFIPDEPVFSEFSCLDEYKSAKKSRELLPFAYMLQDASVYSVDLRHTYCYTILGKEHSGKSNLLKLLIIAAANKNGRIIIYKKTKKSMHSFAESTHAKYIETDRQFFDFLKDDLITIFKDRNKKKHDLMDMGFSDNEIWEKMSKTEPIFIFIDDLAEFINSAAKPSEDLPSMAGTLTNLISKGTLHNIYFFGCLNTADTGSLLVHQLYTEFTKYKTGVLVGGSLGAQKVFTFTNIGYKDMTKTLKKGEAITPSYEDDSLGLRLIVPLIGRDIN